MAVKGKYSYTEYHILENFNQRFAITVLDIIDQSCNVENNNLLLQLLLSSLLLVYFVFL